MGQSLQLSNAQCVIVSKQRVCLWQVCPCRGDPCEALRGYQVGDLGALDKFDPHPQLLHS